MTEQNADRTPAPESALPTAEEPPRKEARKGLLGHMVEAASKAVHDTMATPLATKDRD